MKYYIISALINLGLLLIPIATPVLKEKIEKNNKNEKQIITVDLKNSILEKNKTKGTVGTGNTEKSNGTAGLKKDNSQSKALLNTENLQPQEINVNTPKSQFLPKSSIQSQTQQPISQPTKFSQNTSITTEIKKLESSKSTLSQVSSVTTPKIKNSEQSLPLAAVTKSNNARLSQTNEMNSISKNSNSLASNLAVSKNSESKTRKTSDSNSRISIASGKKSGNDSEENNNDRGTGTSRGSTSTEHEKDKNKDKSSGSTHGGGCKEGRDFSVSYNGHLKLPVEAQRLGKSVTVMVKISFTRGGSVSILGASGGNSVLQAQAIQNARGIHINFITNNCSSGIVRKPFTFN